MAGSALQHQADQRHRAGHDVPDRPGSGASQPQREQQDPADQQHARGRPDRNVRSGTPVQPRPAGSAARSATLNQPTISRSPAPNDRQGPRPPPMAPAALIARVSPDLARARNGLSAAARPPRQDHQSHDQRQPTYAQMNRSRPAWTASTCHESVAASRRAVAGSSATPPRCSQTNGNPRSSTYAYMQQAVPSRPRSRRPCRRPRPPPRRSPVATPGSRMRCGISSTSPPSASTTRREVHERLRPAQLSRTQVRPPTRLTAPTATSPARPARLIAVRPVVQPGAAGLRAPATGPPTSAAVHLVSHRTSMPQPAACARRPRLRR